MNESENSKTELTRQPSLESALLVDDQVDLKELIIEVWKGKWLILLFMVIGACVGVYIALNTAHIYKSDILLSPPIESSNSGLSSFANQLGGLGALAGINIGAPSIKKLGYALEVLKSRRFIRQFIEEHDLFVPLMVINGWDGKTDTYSYDLKVYSPDTGQWLVDEKGEAQKPDMLDAVDYFRESVLGVYLDEETGMITFSVYFYSPSLAQKWVTWLVEDINDEIRQQDMSKAEDSIHYLEEQISQTSLADTRTMLYKLIEQQAQNLMLTKINKDYLLKVVDPAVVIDKPVKPNRKLIAIAALIIGGMLGVVFVLFIFFLKKIFRPTDVVTSG